MFSFFSFSLHVISKWLERQIMKNCGRSIDLQINVGFYETLKYIKGILNEGIS